MNIKLLIADVDGTLVTRNKVLTERTCQAVDRLRAQGVEFTITSGRPPRGLAKLVGPLKITAPLAAFNGGMYVKPDLTTVLAQRTIAPDVARQAVDYLLNERPGRLGVPGHRLVPARPPGAPRGAREQQRRLRPDRHPRICTGRWRAPSRSSGSATISRWSPAPRPNWARAWGRTPPPPAASPTTWTSPIPRRTRAWWCARPPAS